MKSKRKSNTKRKKREITKEDLERNIEEMRKFHKSVLNGTWKPERKVDIV